MPKFEDYQLRDQFNDWLDECLPMVDILGMQYLPSYVLRECDPIAYSVTYSDYLDGLENCEDCGNHPIDCGCES